MKTLAFIGTNSEESNLIKKSLKTKFDILELDLNRVILSYYNRNIYIWYKYDDGFDYLTPDVFFSRSANNDFVCMMVKTLDIMFFNQYENSCLIIDGINRFNVSNRAPKLSSIIEYTQSGHYPYTIVAVSSEIVREFLEFQINEFNYTKAKFVYKPVSGSHGEGMRLIISLSDFGRNDGYLDNVKVYQEFIDLEAEYRVFLYNGQILASMNKIIEQEKSRKLFSGRRMEVIDLPKSIQIFISTYDWRPGFIGADIGLSKDGDIYVFEQNRAPEFEQTNRRLIENNLPTIEQKLTEAIYEELEEKY